MNYEIFISTPLLAFFTGLSSMLGFLSGVLALAFYARLHDPSLLYFAMTILLTYPMFSLATPDPLLIYNLNPVLFVIQNLSVLFATYFYYRLVTSLLTLSSQPRNFISTLFNFVAASALFARLVAIITYNEIIYLVAGVLASMILLLSIILVIRSETKANNLAKLGCIFFSVCMLVYPLIRLGLSPVNHFKRHLPLLLLACISVLSVVWLIGLLKLADDSFKKAELASLRNMARAFIQLRDLMNSPLQTIEFSLNLLRKENEPLEVNAVRMERALLQMRKINRALASYEKDVDWEQTDNFLDLNNFKEE